MAPAGKKRRRHKRLTAAAPTPDINVTPLVDIVLVLLIIFMVVTPASRRAKRRSCRKRRDRPGSEDIVPSNSSWRQRRFTVEQRRRATELPSLEGGACAESGSGSC
jgi:hypothetical protein